MSKTAKTDSRERDLAVLKALCNLPTAPYCEQHVIAWLMNWAKDRGLRVTHDAVGNVYLHYRRGKARGGPLVVEAHMDHPGFMVVGRRRDGAIRAQFRGGVRPSHFAGARAAMWLNEPVAVGTVRPVPANGRWVRVDVLSVKPAPKKQPWMNVILAPPSNGETLSPGTLGMWDLPDARAKGALFTARVCDDLAGVAGVVRMLEEVIAQKIDGHVIGMFSRAEEVGFAGVLAAVINDWLPRNARVIGLETSKGSAFTPQGAGPVVRVGDKTGLFSAGLTHFVNQCAGYVADDDPSFHWQRKLMDGGTCNSTAFSAFGYDATGLCLALGNYHNMTVQGEIGWGAGGKTGKGIASETIHLHDFAGMVRILVEAARRIGTYEPGFGVVRTRLHKLHREQQQEMLRKTTP